MSAISKSGSRFRVRSRSKLLIGAWSHRQTAYTLADHALLLQRVCLHPVGHRPADRRPGIFLDEMRARDGDFGLVFPASAKIPDSTDQDGAGLGVDEQFWNIALGQPLRIVGCYLRHIG